MLHSAEQEKEGGKVRTVNVVVGLPARVSSGKCDLFLQSRRVKEYCFQNMEISFNYPG